MYWHNTLFYLYKKEKRDVLMKASARLAKTTKKSRLFYMLDMVWCSLRYGAMFAEYDDLDFAFRSSENRATILTTFYNFKLYDKINQKEYRKHFHNKIKFLRNFSSMIKRDWVAIDEASDEQLRAFLANNKKVVLKKSMGDSGKQVQVKTLDEGITAEAFREYAAQNGYDLAEQCITNHPAVGVFNETSLNTVRIATVQINGHVEFLFAGLRIGAKGSELDNISQGGAVAPVDLETGKLLSGFSTKRSARMDAEIAEDRIGYQLPYWEELKQLAAEAATVVPQIGFISWDICITENGPEIIEGNESFGSTIMQLACSHTDPGLKPKLEEILRSGGMK